MKAFWTNSPLPEEVLNTWMKETWSEVNEPKTSNSFLYLSLLCHISWRNVIGLSNISIVAVSLDRGIAGARRVSYRIVSYRKVPSDSLAQESSKLNNAAV